MQSQSLHTRSHDLALANNSPVRGPSIRSVHFAPFVQMPLRTGGQSSFLTRSRSRNAPYVPPSSAPSARSWVYPYNQHQPTPLPPSPTDEPSPLPGPFHKQKGLHDINAILGDDHDDNDVDGTDNTQTNSLGIDFGHHQSEPPHSKNKGKKSIIGRVFRGVGTVFGKDPSSSDRKLKRKAIASYDTVPTLATYGDSSSNSASNAGDFPGPSTTLGLLHHPHNVPTPILEVPETEDQHGSPPPEVYRLSDNIPPLTRSRPPPTTPSINSTNNRPKSVSRKPVNAGPSSSRFGEPPPMTESAAGHNNNLNNHLDLEDRTTVMIYEQNLSRAPTGGQTSPPISRNPSSTRASVHPEPGFSSLHPLRPNSFAATQQTHPAPGSIRDPVSVAPTRRTSIASPLAPRSRQLSLNRGVVGQAPSSIPDFPPGPYPPHPTSRATSIVHQLPPPLPLATTATTNPDVSSPVSAHPHPMEDFGKMTLSPPSSKHTVTTSNTTYSSNHSFSSDLSPFARFAKALYKMPWISNDRVTVDYLPDHGLLGDKNVKAKKGKVKRMATWYRSMLASRRNSDNADLLGRGGRRERRRQRDLDISLGSALAELGSPFAAKKRRRGRTERSRRHYHHHHRHHRHNHHHSSSRHHHHHGHGHHGRRATATTMTTMTDDSTMDSVLQTTTPLAPAMYPYFPPYPLTFQPQFPQNDVSPPTTAGLAAQTPGAALTSPAAYQPFYPHTPFYVFQPTAVPPADKHSAGVVDPNSRTTNGPVIPGGVDRVHVPGSFS